MVQGCRSWSSGNNAIVSRNRGSLSLERTLKKNVWLATDPSGVQEASPWKRYERPVKGGQNQNACDSVRSFTAFRDPCVLFFCDFQLHHRLRFGSLTNEIF